MVDRYVKRRFDIDCFHTAFRNSYGTDFLFRGERHDFAEITLVVSGAILMTREENVYAMGAGDLIFLAPEEFHRWQSADGTAPTVYTTAFHTTGELPRALREGYFTLDGDAVSEFEAIMERLIPFVAGESGNEYEGQYLADALAAFLIGRCCSAEDRGLSHGSAREYNRVVSDMSACVCEGYDLATFARRSSISLSYLKLLFAKYAGVSPKSYYSALRAAEAARLLRQGIGAAEITARMHFSSPSYFSLFFKRHFGVAPQRYKQGLDA